jgi:hypothetical protein
VYDSVYEVHPIDLTIFPWHCYFAFSCSPYFNTIDARTKYLFFWEYAVMTSALLWSLCYDECLVLYDTSIRLLLNWGIRRMERWEHYIYMALFLIVNNELRHFGICNDDLLFPSSNQIFFRALDCYLQKKICSLFEDKLVLSWTLIFFPNIPLNFSFHMSGLFISIVFPLLMSHDYILFKISFAFVYIWSASLTSLTWNLSVLTSNLSIIALVFISL